MAQGSPLGTVEGWFAPARAADDMSMHEFLAAQGAAEAMIALACDTSTSYGTNARDVSALQLGFVEAFQRGQRSFRPAVYRARAAVHAQGGQRCTAGAAVCALPFAAQRKVRIEPPLAGRVFATPGSPSDDEVVSLLVTPYGDKSTALDRLGPEGAARQVIAGTVVGVRDGDTVDVRLQSGMIRVRLHGIDAPERDGQDRYERLVARLWLGGLDVNAELVKRGAACVASLGRQSAGIPASRLAGIRRSDRPRQTRTRAADRPRASSGAQSALRRREMPRPSRPRPSSASEAGSGTTSVLPYVPSKLSMM